MKKTRQHPPVVPATASQLRTGSAHPFGALSAFTPLGGRNSALYRAMREALPILDAAITKLVRLTGGFTVSCADKAAEKALAEFLHTVPCGRAQYGIESFLSAYLDSLLTYGAAVGEMVVSGGKLRAICWGDVTRLHAKEGASPLDVTLGVSDCGEVKPLAYPQLVLFTTLNPEAQSPYGVSLLRSMPFLAEILLKIYQTIGENWERAGNVRYSVVYKPSGEAAEAAAGVRADEIAAAWSEAMRESKAGAVRDFVAVGDVEIKVIGADGKILDSEVPVRQLLEQLVAKTGLPPFLLGLNWSSTERMSSQQADLLTSELWSLRRAVEPALRRICRFWLDSEGYGGAFEIVWDEITLQDTVEEAHAALYRAQTENLRKDESSGNSKSRRRSGDGQPVAGAAGED